jgi:hypothetical protein
MNFLKYINYIELNGNGTIIVFRLKGSLAETQERTQYFTEFSVIAAHVFSLRISLIRNMIPVKQFDKNYHYCCCVGGGE